MTGGVIPPGFVTEKESVRHLEAEVTDFVPDGETTPFNSFVELTDSVEGPEMRNVEKSNLSWQILELHLQIVIRQAPALALPTSKYVQFSLDLELHP